jgi:hypothetical protein
MIPSLFSGRLFQVAYVVRDAGAAIEGFRSRCAIDRWKRLALPPGYGVNGLAFAYVNGVLHELVEVDVDLAIPVYRSHIPDAPDDARFHHLAYMMDTEAAYWEAVAASQAAGFPEAVSGEFQGILTYYADSFARLGHYTELVHLKPDARDFFADVPHN